MAGFTSVVKKVIDRADVILEVVDARFIDETSNSEIEARVKRNGRILIKVINKCDYVDKDILDEVKKKYEHCVFISAKNHHGINLLKTKIKKLAAARRKNMPLVGVLGYPNVGKSSIINVLKGKSSARTSSEAGFTKGAQYLRVKNDFLMIDTPGVISRGETDDEELVLVGAKNPSSIDDPDLAVMTLMKRYPGLIEESYGVEVKKDKEEVIVDIALKLNFKKKGDLPDIARASRKILKDWIDGNIK